LWPRPENIGRRTGPGVHVGIPGPVPCPEQWLPGYPAVMATPTQLSWTSARRIALRAQGLGRRRADVTPDRAASRRALAGTLRTTRILQIDSVSVFARAHLMPVFSRYGCWDSEVLESATRPGRGRLARECLAHEATYADLRVDELMDFRRRRVLERDWGEIRRAGHRADADIDQVLEALATHGPLSAAGLARHLGDVDRPAQGWGWRRTRTQWLVEFLFRSGRIDCVGRSPQFERLYAVGAQTARSGRWPLDPVGTGAADEQEAIGELTRISARALGIGDLPAIADYFRLPQSAVRPHLMRLRETGELRDVQVRHPAGPMHMYLHRDAPGDSPVHAACLVSPFDPVVFHRPRLENLFDVPYRIGIYTPRAKRTHGYYALPFLLGDRFVARVDLRVDRRRQVLEVREVHRETLAHTSAAHLPDDQEVAAALAAELLRAAHWQRAGAIEVAGVGDLSGALAEQVRSRRP
jgi:uncharacterized protein YcaQ